MTKKTLIAPAVLLLLLLAMAGGVYAYDGARPDAVAPGVRIGGVDVGGMEAGEARGVLQRELVARLRRPVRVDHGDKTWTLRAREAKVTTDVDAMLAEALRRSDEGGPLRRTWRRLRGTRQDLDLQPQVAYSDRAVVRLLDRVRRGVARPARDASFSLEPDGVSVTPGRSGVAVQASRLHEEIAAALSAPGARRRFAVATRKVTPKVTAKRLAKQNRVVLIASRASNTLKLYEGLKLTKTYGIAAGQAAYPTPTGQFSIVNKAVDPVWSVPNSTWAGSLAGSVIPGGAPNNPLKARWMGITSGVGIHGTSDDGSIGSNASHGCLRMHVADVIDLYPRVPVGTKILIT